MRQRLRGINYMRSSSPDPAEMRGDLEHLPIKWLAPRLRPHAARDRDGSSLAATKADASLARRCQPPHAVIATSIASCDRLSPPRAPNCWSERCRVSTSRQTC